MHCHAPQASSQAKAPENAATTAASGHRLLAGGKFCLHKAHRAPTAACWASIRAMLSPSLKVLHRHPGCGMSSRGSYRLRPIHSAVQAAWHGYLYPVAEPVNYVSDSDPDWVTATLSQVAQPHLTQRPETGQQWAPHPGSSTATGSLQLFAQARLLSSACSAAGLPAAFSGRARCAHSWSACSRTIRAPSAVSGPAV